MAIQIEADATVSELGQQEVRGGKRGGKRHWWGMALIAALALALIAGVAAGRALSTEPSDASVPGQERVIRQDPDADAFAMAQAARPADTVDWEQAGRTQTNLGWTDARDYAPAAAPATTSGSQQAELYAIEVRDNGAGTTEGDGGPCREPGRSCDR